MKSLSQLLQALMMLLYVGSLISCNAQEKTENTGIKANLARVPSHIPLGPLDSTVKGCCDTSQYTGVIESTDEIAEYVRRIFEDSKGQFWFGTNKYGVGRYDGESLTYFSIQEGLSGTQVTGIIEDHDGNIWFSTSGGVSRFNGETFTNFNTKDGLNANNVSTIFQDSKGTIWAGTIHGLCQFDGARFTSIAIPLKAEAGYSNVWVASITDDKEGNIWLGLRGNGACKYNGETFSFLTKEDGLCDNDIVCILEDKKGNLWFSSMFGGISMYNGATFTSYNANNSIGDNEVWNMYEDRAGTIWFSSEGFGVYRFDGETMKNYGKKEGMQIGAVQCIFQDKRGLYWIGGGGGLYLYDRFEFMKVTKQGPWEPC